MSDSSSDGDSVTAPSAGTSQAPSSEFASAPTSQATESTRSRRSHRSRHSHRSGRSGRSQHDSAASSVTQSSSRRSGRSGRSKRSRASRVANTVDEVRELDDSDAMAILIDAGDADSSRHSQVLPLPPLPANSRASSAAAAASRYGFAPVSVAPPPSDVVREPRIRVIPFAELNTLPKPHRPTERLKTGPVVGTASPGPVYSVRGAFDKLAPDAPRTHFHRPGVAFGSAPRTALQKRVGAGTSDTPAPLYIEMKWRTQNGAANFGSQRRFLERDKKFDLANAGGAFAGPGAYGAPQNPSDRRAHGALMLREKRSGPQLGGDDDYISAQIRSAAAQALASAPIQRPVIRSNGPFDPTKPTIFGGRPTAKVVTHVPGPGAYRTDAGVAATRRSVAKGGAKHTAPARAKPIEPASTLAGPGAYAVKIDATRPRAPAAVAYLTS